MMEVVTVVLGLLCVGIFLAHAVDTYWESSWGTLAWRARIL